MSKSLKKAENGPLAKLSSQLLINKLKHLTMSYYINSYVLVYAPGSLTY